MKLTRHAKVRRQQRGIPPLIVEWAIRYGARKHDGRGAVKCYFDQKSRRALARDVGKEVVDHLSPLLNTVIVQSIEDEVVITMMHRTKSI